MSDVAATPRPASTLVVLRPGPFGPEVLMVRRHRGSSFMADAHVFPGGRVETEDGSGEAASRAAAVRELAEEAGLLLEAAALVPWAHWITPSSEPKRFDVRFYLAAAIPGQVARHDEVETVEHFWATPAEVLAAYGKRAIKLAPPTIRTLEELTPFTDVEAALAAARTRVLTPILPKLLTARGALTIVLPWDPDYAALPGEGIVVDPAHPAARPPSRLWLSEGHWWRPGQGS